MDPDGSDLAAVRSAHQRQPLLPFVPLVRGPTPRQAPNRARSLLRDGWSRPGSPPVDLTPPLAWSHAAWDRSVAWSMHAWRPVDTLILGSEGHPEHWAAACAIALDWVAQHPQRTTDGFAWYDMAVGLRTYRLTYLIDAELRIQTLTDEELASLLGALDEHAAALLDDDEFMAHNNHGYFQIAGMLALARRLPWRDDAAHLATVASERLQAMLDRQFAPDGIHLEHSPAYHLMMLEALNALWSSGLVTDPTLGQVRDLVDDALAWFVMPDGTLAGFGDSHRSFISPVWRGNPQAVTWVEDRFQSPATRYAASAGALGRPPQERLRAFADGGYFVAKPHWPDSPEAGGSYLAMQAGFHSRTHKHADDLSIVWFDAGGHLLVDAGRYGFVGETPKRGTPAWEEASWYDHPVRRYVESTRAHNTVEIDGVNLDRRRPPYGSALVDWGEEDGIFRVVAEAPLEKGSFRRELQWQPGRSLMVVDRISTGWLRNCRAVQWWHLDPRFAVVRSDREFLASDGTVTLRFSPAPGLTPIGPIRGQTEPHYQGFASFAERELVANPAIGFAVRGRSARLAVTITIEPPRVGPG